MTTGALPTTIVVSLSHDGTSWTDVTQYVMTSGGLNFNRGRNRVLGEWVPGSFNLYASNVARAIDPTNDAATFQVRPGDEIKITVNGVAAWRGLVDAANVTYQKSGTYPTSDLSLSGTDGLAVVNRATVTDVNPSSLGSVLYTGRQVNYVLALSSLAYYRTATVDTGDVVTALPGTGTLNALTVLQTCTRTEGGNSQLFTLKDGTLRWRSRYAKPSQVVTFGSSGVPYSDIQVDYTDDEWSNYVNVNCDAHYDSLDGSTTSVTVGTGSKTFTMSTLAGYPTDNDSWGFGPGDAVYIESNSTPTVNNMTGTVTSFDESTRVLVCNITSKNGTATKTDWTFYFTKAAATSSASDAQSFNTFHAYRTDDVATYHRTTAAAAAEATILAASRAWPSRRVSSVTVDLGASGVASYITTLLGLEVGDAIDVSLDLGTGSPSVLRQVRQIDGIAHRISGATHSITFTLGNEVAVDFTATLKQNGASVGTTLREGSYSMRDGWCEVVMVLEATSSGTANTEIKATPVGLPAPFQTAHTAHGVFTFAGTSTVNGTCYFDGTDIKLYKDAATTPVGQTPNLTVGSGNRLSCVMLYPTAAAKTFTAYIDQAGVAKSAVTTGYYTIRDGWCMAVIIITANAAGTAGNSILGWPTGLPTPAVSPNQCQGWATYTVASSSTRYPLSARYDTVNLLCSTHNRNGLIGGAPSLATASGDTLCITLEYPV